MRKLFYEDVVKTYGNRNQIDWKDSVGKEIPFVYDEYEGVIKIINYNSKDQEVTFEYRDKIFQLSNYALRNAKFRYVLADFFKYEIGEIISNENHSHKILKREIVEKIYNGRVMKKKQYTYECLKCNYIGTHYEEDIGRRWCPCCNGRVVVEGINDIPSTVPWMIDYFQGGYDEAKLYTCQSNKKIFPKCPDCGMIKSKSIRVSDIYNWHSIGCECSDQKTYPNKFIIELLRQLQVNFDYEITFSWANQYRYDAVIYTSKEKTEHYNILIEMDGGYNHGRYTYKENANVEQILIGRNEILDDLNKEIVALENGNYLVRIDCQKSDVDYIKENILNSKLAEWLDLSDINWDECDKFASKNIIKSMANYIIDNPDVTFNILKEKFFYKSNSTIHKHLEKAVKFKMLSEELYNKVQKNALKRVSVYVYDKKLNLLKEYRSKKELYKYGEEDIGVKFTQWINDKTILNQPNLYKHSFYISDHELTKEELKKYKKHQETK